MRILWESVLIKRWAWASGVALCLVPLRNAAMGAEISEPMSVETFGALHDFLRTDVGQIVLWRVSRLSPILDMEGLPHERQALGPLARHLPSDFVTRASDPRQAFGLVREIIDAHQMSRHSALDQVHALAHRLLQEAATNPDLVKDLKTRADALRVYEMYGDVVADDVDTFVAAVTGVESGWQARRLAKELETAPMPETVHVDPLDSTRPARRFLHLMPSMSNRDMVDNLQNWDDPEVQRAALRHFVTIAPHIEQKDIYRVATHANINLTPDVLVQIAPFLQSVQIYWLAEQIIGHGVETAQLARSLLWLARRLGAKYTYRLIDALTRIYHNEHLVVDWSPPEYNAAHPGIVIVHLLDILRALWPDPSRADLEPFFGILRRLMQDPAVRSNLQCVLELRRLIFSEYGFRFPTDLAALRRGLIPRRRTPL